MKRKISYNFLIKPVVILLGLTAAIYLILWIETVRPSDFGFYKDIFRREEIIEKRKSYPLKATGQVLSDEDIEIAKIAWRYFENNYQLQTGFVNSVDRYTSTTLWDLTSSLMATVSAYEIGLIDSTTMSFRLEKAFESLLSIPLYDNKLPNKVYNTITLDMTTYDNRPTSKGVGWSSMDLGRFLNLCSRLMHNYPQFTLQIKKTLSRWDFESAIENAALVGIGLSFKDGKEMRVQEGKLGYEEYCAKGFQHMGYDVSNALQYTDFIKFIKIYGIDIAVDSREVKYHPGYNYILSEPYILDGFEYGFDVHSRELAYRVFLVQKKRYEATGILTAVSETHVDTIPYFIYNSVYVDGNAWNCVSESGENTEHLKTFSTSAAFGWYYLFKDPYSDLLFDHVRDLYHPDLGWYSGIYENTGVTNTALTANVNGLILTAINYKLKGPLLKGN